MTDIQHLAARIACANIIAAFAHHVDHREFDRAVALFCDDGRFLRPDLQAHGHAAIAEIWSDRPVSLFTKHLCSAPYFVKEEPDRIESVTNFTLYQVDHEADGLPRFDRPAAIAEFHDIFRLTEAGWKIAERRGVPVMLG